jgi:hypothetical protein
MKRIILMVIVLIGIFTIVRAQKLEKLEINGSKMLVPEVYNGKFYISEQEGTLGNYRDMIFKVNTDEVKKSKSYKISTESKEKRLSKLITNMECFLSFQIDLSIILLKEKLANYKNSFTISIEPGSIYVNDLGILIIEFQFIYKDEYGIFNMKYSKTSVDVINGKDNYTTLIQNNKF